MMGTFHEDIVKEAKSIPEILAKWETGLVVKDARVITLDKLKELFEKQLKEEEQGLENINKTTNEFAKSLKQVSVPNQAGRIQMMETLLNRLAIANNLLRNASIEAKQKSEQP